MRKIAALAAAGALSFFAFGCGDTAQEACTKAWPGTTADAINEEESYCMRPGDPRPKGEVENEDGTGFVVDD